MVNTSPSASPQASSGPGGLPLPSVPAGGGSGSGSLYNLGAWKDQNINISGFPRPVVAALANAGLDTSKPQTAETVAAALSKVTDAQTVAQLQQMLFYGGFYSNGVKLSDLQLGSFSTEDETALKNLVLAGGQSGQSLGTYLTTRAATGYAQGNYLNQLESAMSSASSGMIYNPITGSYTPASQTFVNKPSQAQEDAAIQAAAQKLLGHLPSQDDIAGFRAYWDQAYESGQKSAIKTQLAQQQAAASINLPNASDLGGALQRTGGIPFLDRDSAPQQTFPGLPASQERNPDFAGQPNMFNVPNPAYGAYQKQYAADQGLLGQVNAAGDQLSGTNGPISVQEPGSIGDAAMAYLQQHDPGAIQTQNAISAYGDLLNFIKGDGSIK